MIINWIAVKAQQFLSAQDEGLDELSIGFDFALSAEIADLLYAQNKAEPQIEIMDTVTVTRTVLDEHELALA